jgi:hypothetical protein
LYFKREHEDSESSEDEEEGSLGVGHDCDGGVLEALKIRGYSFGFSSSKLLEWIENELDSEVLTPRTSSVVIYAFNQPLWLPVRYAWPVHSKGWRKAPRIRMDWHIFLERQRGCCLMYPIFERATTALHSQ